VAHAAAPGTEQFLLLLLLLLLHSVLPNATLLLNFRKRAV
jgi:hypothetical protein